jgi:acyl-CoA synthetase (AMP-forming)/AMP-acid ligase II
MPEPFNPLIQPDLLAHMAEGFPDAVAWKNLADDSELRMGDWHTTSNRLARGLRARGLLPGGRVALAVTPDQPLEWLISYMAIHKAGGIAVPLNTRLSGPELRRILALADVTALLASAAVIARDVAAATPGAVVATVGAPPATGLGWDDLLDPDDADLGHRITADDIADIMYTSGTTGVPKGVVVRHGGLSSNDRYPTEWSGSGFITSSPFSTTTGSLLLCGPMRGGLSGWFLPRFETARWLQQVETDRPVVAFLVPAMVQLIVADPRAHEADLSSLAVVSIGSAPIASETLRRFGALLPAAEVLIGYGMTEFGAATALPLGDAGSHLGSVGLPLPGVQLHIADEAGGPLPTGQVGQVVIRGDRPVRQYFGEPDESGLTWRSGWLQSGDLGYLDPDGYLWIVGRSKETIIRGGNNVMPGEVEAALFAHPDVADAAVAAIAHPVLGEDVAAWVVLRTGATGSGDALRTFLLERLADYKVPRRFSFVDALPRNEAGKVQKSLLILDDDTRSAS